MGGRGMRYSDGIWFAFVGSPVLNCPNRFTSPAPPETNLDQLKFFNQDYANKTKSTPTKVFV